MTTIPAFAPKRQVRQETLPNSPTDALVSAPYEEVTHGQF